MNADRNLATEMDNIEIWGSDIWHGSDIYADLWRYDGSTGYNYYGKNHTNGDPGFGDAVVGSHLFSGTDDAPDSILAMSISLTDLAARTAEYTEREESPGLVLGSTFDVGIRIAGWDPNGKTWTGAADRSGFMVTVPEPSALLLLAAGFVGLLCYAWRKRR